MGDLTKNLSRHEFKCSCGCGFDTADYELVNILQSTADRFAREYKQDVRIDITGGNRCRRHNDALRDLYNTTDGKQGAKTAPSSQHLNGRAVDVKFFFRNTNRQIPVREIAKYLDHLYQDEIAIGTYVNRLHIDTRTNAGQRW